MSRSRIFRTICGLGTSVVMLAATAQAQPADKRTYFTFSRPITLPGVTLPAGRYIFRLADAESTRKVIQVTSADGTNKPYAMLFSINNERTEAPKDAEVRFMETARGTPSAVKSWWYPGERIGYEFIYPKDQARRLAQGTGVAVLTTKSKSKTADETRTAELERVDPNGRDQDVNAPGTSSGNGASQTGSIASIEGLDRTPPQASPQNPVSTTAPRVARNSLPRTASNLPLAGLIGALSLVGFVSLRSRRTRTN